METTTKPSASSAAANACVDVAQWFSVNYNDQTAESYVRAPIALVYVAIFIAGLSGNILVVVSVCRHRALQTVRNFFIVSLSCSDIVVCLTSLPITPVTFILKNWLFGSFLCYAFPLVQGMSVCISTFTLTAVAVDRYILIIYPTHKPIHRHQAVAMIVSIWALAAGVSVPMVVHYNHFYGPDRQMDVDPSSERAQVVDAQNETVANSLDKAPSTLTSFCGYFCEEIWPSDRVRQIYGSFVMILQFLIPLTIIAFCYVHICVRLAARNGAKRRPSSKKRGSAMMDDNPRLSLSQTTIPDISMGLNACAATTTAVTTPSVTESRRQAVLKRKRRTNRMLIAMVIIFAVCWAPQVLMNILRDLRSLPSFVNDQMYFYSLVCHSIAMSSTIWNPVLYSWMNETFRRSFLELLPCFSKLCRRKRTGRKRKWFSYGGSSNHPRDGDSQLGDGAGVAELLAADKRNAPSERRKSAASDDAAGNEINSPQLSPAPPTETNPLLKVDKVELTKSKSFSRCENGATMINGGGDEHQEDLTSL